jgi:predicted methyltransferase
VKADKIALKTIKPHYRKLFQYVIIKNDKELELSSLSNESVDTICHDIDSPYVDSSTSFFKV